MAKEKQQCIPAIREATIGDVLEALLRIEHLLANQFTRPGRKRPTTSPSAVLRATYSEAFQERWGVSATWNASINGMLAQVAQRIPADDHEALVRFFMAQNDAWYLRDMHHVRCLMKDCEMLLTRMRSGVVITPGKAKQIEQAAANADASRAYLERKHGGKKDRGVSGSADAGDEGNFPDSQ